MARIGGGIGAENQPGYRRGWRRQCNVSGSKLDFDDVNLNLTLNTL